MTGDETQARRRDGSHRTAADREARAERRDHAEEGSVRNV